MAALCSRGLPSAVGYAGSEPRNRSVFGVRRPRHPNLLPTVSSERSGGFALPGPLSESRHGATEFRDEQMLAWRILVDVPIDATGQVLQIVQQHPSIFGGYRTRDAPDYRL
jgi:hypothetical protein